MAIFSFLKSRILLVASGFVLLALFIWYVGPLFGIGDYKPLDPVLNRLIAIALVVVVWAGTALARRLRASRASDKLVAAVVQQSRAEERPSAEALQLRERFEEAVAVLKQKRRRGHSLYDLPWYVIIGAPGSGKTTALVNSGLNFPLEQRSGKGALRGVGGTRNCDWWFTDEAVLLDTAGRYTTQDSDASADSAGWSEFLALLKKYRKRRPVNGVILTISAHDLMVQGHAGRDAQAAATRRRLNELNKELNIQLPVYLMVTKCDLVAGFTEYFDDLAQEGRAQVWGVTFPYELTTSGKAAGSFASEFDALTARLNERVFPRLEEERDPRRRVKAFAFPQQFAALRELLDGFIADVFASTRFDQQILLRGVYFTSGTQEGTPIDRLLGALGRRFAMAPDAVTPSGRGRAYFIERLLKEVLFAESGLAGVNRRVEVQKAAAQLGAYVAMALVAVLGFIAFSISFSRNRTYIGEVDADVKAFQQAPKEAGNTLETILPRLNAVQKVSDSANRYRDVEPWAMRWGLYQGSSLGNAARDAYSRELAGVLLPQVTSRIEQRLASYSSEPEKLYEYFKAYLMLGDPKRLDKQQLGYIADLEWKAAYAADPETGAAVSRHFRNLLEYPDRLRAMTLDQSLVARARSTIQQASIPQLVYRQIRLAYSDDSPLRLDVAAGVGAEQVFRLKSGASLSKPVPRIYTAQGFREVTSQSADELVRAYASDYWVWGEGRPSLTASSKLKDDVLDLYEKDYIAAWDAILSDIELASFPNLAATSNGLAILAGSPSPFRGILKIVDDNTYLVPPADPSKSASTAATVKDKLEGIFQDVKRGAGLSTRVPGVQVTEYFARIHQMVGGEVGKAPVDGVISKIGEIQRQLAAVGTRYGEVPPLEALTRAGQGGTMKSLQQDATTMPPQVGAIVTQITGRAAAAATVEAGNEFMNRYSQDVLAPCRQFISGRYPFNASSQTDVALGDFGRLFGQDGIFDRFFKANLQNLVDTSRRPWVLREDQSGGSVGISGSVLRQFEAAQRIRDKFFGNGGQMPQVRFTVTPITMDGTLSRFVLEIDGQTFTYQFGPERSQQAQWPGQMPVAAATFEDRASGRPNIAFQGQWAWFRLLDVAQTRTESDLRHEVTFEKSGFKATVRIEAASVLNPFGGRDLQQFRCEV
ncbi:MAG TPA: type VI secretion system membrane subunit TssM [Vicinamibacterales bacterium]|nr:type VI secretion system membrane subunit TssM [Vicinamibacterales bacterium]